MTFDEVTVPASRATEMAQADALADVTSGIIDVLGRFLCRCAKPPCVDIPFLRDAPDDEVESWMDMGERPCASGLALFHALLLARALQDLSGTGELGVRSTAADDGGAQ